MTGFKKLTAIAVPLMENNVDTDIIIPSREMKRVSKVGLGEGLFAGRRYKAVTGREVNPDFILNNPEYDKAEILLSGLNFGCGSSREHAVWALGEYGIRAILAPSFGGIFYNNCICNGLLPVIIGEADMIRLADWVMAAPRKNKLAIDLEKQTVTGPQDEIFPFDINPRDKEMLLGGYDMIDMTLQRLDDILAFERQDRENRRWAKLA